MTESPQDPVRSIDRALKLLVEVCEARGDGVTLTDAAKAVALAPSTAHRVLATLEAAKFVARDDRGRYVAGHEVARLGALRAAPSLAEVAQPLLDRLASATGETCYLVLPNGVAEATYAAWSPGGHAVHHVSWLGKRIPTAPTAAGAALRSDVGRNGIAVRVDGVEAGVTALAAPVVRGAAAVAAISLVGPSFRLPRARHNALAEQIVAVAAELC